MATSTDFNAPVYLDDAQSAGNFEVQDLNDPSLLAAELDTNADKNAYDRPAPLRDGFVRVKAKQIFKEVDTPSGKVTKAFQVKLDKKNQPYAYTALELTVQDPGGQYDGFKVTDNFLSTMPARNGGIPVVRVLQVLGVTIPPRCNVQTLMDTLEKALAGEPDLVVETAWEGSLSMDDQKLFDDHKAAKPKSIIGMHRFPDKIGDNGQPTGEKSPEYKYTNPGFPGQEFILYARPRVMGYFGKDHPTGAKK